MCAVTFGPNLHALESVLPYKGLKLWVVVRVLRHVVRKQMWGHGIGRHHVDDIIQIGVKDMTALSKFLGDDSIYT